MDDSYSKFRNHYSTLGVERNATKSEIKSAFRKLVKIWHPDNNKAPDAEAKFKEIGAAYEILNNDSWRAEYDGLLREYEEHIRYEQNKAYQQTKQAQSKTYENNDATTDGQTFRDSQYGSERQTDYKQYNQNNYYSKAYSNWEQRARTFREQDEARAWEQASRYAGMAVGEVLASIVDTVLYGEKEGRGSLNFIDYNLLGLKVWICAGLAALCFTLVFALPAAYVIMLVVKSFFHKERFVGFVPLLMGAVLVLSEFLLAGFLVFELPKILHRTDNTASEPSFRDTADTSYYDSRNENDGGEYDAVYNDFDNQYEAEPDYSDCTAYILSPDYDTGNFRVEPSLNAEVLLVVQHHEILRYLEEEAYDAENDIVWYNVYHEATGNIGWISRKIICTYDDIAQFNETITFEAEWEITDVPAHAMPFAEVPGDQQWQMAYAEFLRESVTHSNIVNDEFIVGSYDAPPLFCIYDIDNNGLPELIRYSDDGDEDGLSFDVFIYKNEGVQKLGSLMYDIFGSIGAPTTNTEGLFSDVSYKGHYGSLYYYTIKNDNLVWQLVREYNYRPYYDESEYSYIYIYDSHGNSRIISEGDIGYPEAYRQIEHTPLDFYGITEDNINNVIIRSTR